MTIAPSIEENETVRSAWKFVLLALTPWSVVTGILYLWGFWSTFGINILQFASLADLVASAMYPLVIGGGSFVIGLAAGYTQPRIPDSTMERIVGKPEKTLGFLRRNSRPLIGFWALALLLLYSSELQVRWFIGPLLFMIGASVIILEQPELHAKLVAFRFGIMAVLLGTFIPPLAYGWGRADAERIVVGAKFLVVHSDESYKATSKPVADEQKLRFLGHVGEFDFLYHPVKQHLVITKPAEGTQLELVQYKPPLRETEDGVFARFYRWISGTLKVTKPTI